MHRRAALEAFFAPDATLSMPRTRPHLSLRCRIASFYSSFRILFLSVTLLSPFIRMACEHGHRNPASHYQKTDLLFFPRQQIPQHGCKLLSETPCFGDGFKLSVDIFRITLLA